jgi:hypothetical protein
VLHSAGLRLSAAGGLVFLVSLLGLLVLPDAIAAFGMLAGGVGVWAGFVWTLLSYYMPDSEDR